MIRLALDEAKATRWAWLLGALAVVACFILLDQSRPHILTTDFSRPIALPEGAGIGALPDRSALAASAPANDAFAAAAPDKPPLPITPEPFIAPPPPVAPPAPVVEAPPALAAQYLGEIRLQDGRVLYQFLRADKLLSLQAGEAVDAQTRFEGVDGSNLVFMYLPLSARQYLPRTPLQ